MTESALFDLRGHGVGTLLSDDRRTGTYGIHRDGRDEAGRSVSAGVYYVRLRAEGMRAATVSLIVVR